MKHLRCGYHIIAECASERTFKIGKYLAKIWTSLAARFFLTTGLYIYTGGQKNMPPDLTASIDQSNAVS